MKEEVYLGIVVYFGSIFCVDKRDSAAAESALLRLPTTIATELVCNVAVLSTSICSFIELYKNICKL